ncbi:MAG: hypothetical protein V3V99_11760 [candidate division Zixibacteria bacterium]
MKTHDIDFSPSAMNTLDDVSQGMYATLLDEAQQLARNNFDDRVEPRHVLTAVGNIAKRIVNAGSQGNRFVNSDTKNRWREPITKQEPIELMSTEA